MKEKAMPWERQYNESHQAFGAFHEYCLLGDKRSIRKVAEKLGKSDVLISRWSSKWNWVERSREYDNELVRQEVKEARDGIQEMRKRQIEFGKFIQSRAMEAIMERARSENGLRYEEIRDLVTMITKGATLEEHARKEGLADYAGFTTTGGNSEISPERRLEIEEFFNADSATEKHTSED